MNAVGTLSRLKSSALFMNHILPISVILVAISMFAFDRRMIVNPVTARGVAVIEKVKASESLTVQWSVDRSRICHSVVGREIVDSVGVIHRFDGVLGPRSQTIGRDMWFTNVPLPPKIAWGPARYRATVHFRCGWTHEIWPYVEVMPEVHFEIIPDK